MTDQPDRQQLMTLRIIWAALLIGQVIFFLAIAFVLWPQGQRTTNEQFLQTLFYVACAMLLTVVPVTFFIRSVTFRNGRDERGNVRPPAYATGNIIFWAGCEGVSFFGLVGALLNHGPWPHLVVSVIAVAAQILAFPTGAPMRQPL
jgi:F0F1-type ATP synthase membrane subunit c/vacuolar-type H+-ATPase subunit K